MRHPFLLAVTITIGSLLAPRAELHAAQRPTTNLASRLAVANTTALLTQAWPIERSTHLTDLGRGIGIVFSPDLSVEGNCRFYDALGFACFQDADWRRVLDGIHANNVLHPDRPVRTLILETHGTNGNGLKLQASYAPNADRSYIAVGALQEQLEPDGIRSIIISACNSGRLLRPQIYRTLDPNNGDKLFLPPTRGIVDASPNWNPALSRITIITPASSHIESSLEGATSELGWSTRYLLTRSVKTRGLLMPTRFAVSDMFMQMVLRDPRLLLTTGAYVDQLSREEASDDQAEQLYVRFAARLNQIARREMPSSPTPRKRTKKPAAKTTAASAHRTR